MADNSDWKEPDEDIGAEAYEDFFDVDKARKAAEAIKIYQDVSVGSSKEKMREAGAQERQSAAQRQEFAQADEARDYAQSQRAYRY